MSCELYLDQKISTPLFFFNWVTLPSQFPQLPQRRNQCAPPATPSSSWGAFLNAHELLHMQKSLPTLSRNTKRKTWHSVCWLQAGGGEGALILPRGVSVSWGVCLGSACLSSLSCELGSSSGVLFWARQEVGCPVEGMSSSCPLQHHPHGCCLLISRHKGGSRPSLLLPLPKGQAVLGVGRAEGWWRSFQTHLHPLHAGSCSQLPFQTAPSLGVFVLETAGGRRSGD